MNVFKAGKKRGGHWANLEKAMQIIENLSLDISSDSERKFEDRISGALQPNFPKFIDQRNVQQVIMRVELFGHDHRPDMSIDTDGTAIEVQRINEIINKRRGVTPSTALRLAKFFGVSEDFWMNLQLRWDMYKAKLNEAKELKTIRAIRMNGELAHSHL